MVLKKLLIIREEMKHDPVRVEIMKKEITRDFNETGVIILPYGFTVDFISDGENAFILNSIDADLIRK